MRLFSVRGAIQLDENTAENMETHVIRLIENLVSENEITLSDLIHILFTQTQDINKGNPATSLRKAGYSGIPLFCSVEPEYPGSLPKTIRVLLTYYQNIQHKPKPVYLNGAQILRSDLFTE